MTLPDGISISRTVLRVSCRRRPCQPRSGTLPWPEGTSRQPFSRRVRRRRLESRLERLLENRRVEACVGRTERAKREGSPEPESLLSVCSQRSRGGDQTPVVGPSGAGSTAVAQCLIPSETDGRLERTTWLGPLQAPGRVQGLLAVSRAGLGQGRSRGPYRLPRRRL